MLKMMFRLLKIYVYFRLFIWMLDKEIGESGGTRSREEHERSSESEGSTGNVGGGGGIG